MIGVKGMNGKKPITPADACIGLELTLRGARGVAVAVVDDEGVRGVNEVDAELGPEACTVVCDDETGVLELGVRTKFKCECEVKCMGIEFNVCVGNCENEVGDDAVGVSSRRGTACRELRLASSGLLDARGERVMGGEGEERTSMDKDRQELLLTHDQASQLKVAIKRRAWLWNRNPRERVVRPEASITLTGCDTSNIERARRSVAERNRESLRCSSTGGRFLKA